MEETASVVVVGENVCVAAVDGFVGGGDVSPLAPDVVLLAVAALS